VTAAMLHGEGTIAVEIQFDGINWVDVTADVMYDAKVNITQGRGDETSQAQPAGLTFALLNTTGNYTPYSPASIYYPNVRRNTAIRVRFDPGSGFKQLFYGYAVGFTPAWDTSAKKATVGVVAAGALRRLTQGKSPIQSALTRAILASQPTGYWPLDEPQGSNYAASAIVGVQGLYTQVADPVFGVPGPGGAASAVDLGQRNSGLQTSGPQSALAVIPLPPSSATSYRFEISLICPDTDGYSLPISLYTAGDIWNIAIQLTGTGINVHTSFTDGTVRNDAASADPNDGLWHRLRFEMAKSGADTIYAMTLDGVSILAVTLTGVAFGQLSQAKFGSGVGTLSAGSRLAVTAMALWQPYAPPVAVDTFAANSGYTGETASARITRFCAEEGIGIIVTGTSDRTMGPQPIAARVDVLRDAETADGGVLYDGFGTGLGYICRSSRYNLTAAITADMSAGQVGPAFAPVDDDQRNRNDVAISRSGGATARAVDSTGPLGTDTIDVYDTSLTVNLDSDDPLLHIAEWNVGLGTVQGLRYPTLPFDLVASTALIPSWLNAGTISFRTDVTNVTSKAVQHPPGAVSVIVEGYSMVLDLASWRITANCSPFAPWRVFIIQDSVLGRVDTGGSSLTGPVTNAATSLPVVTGSGPPWTTAGGDMPFDINLGGEQCTVTAVAASSTALTRVGAFISTSALGASDFTTALANWNSITGVTLPVVRWYQAQGDFSIGSTSLAQMVTAGVKVCLTLRPDYATLNPSHVTSIDTMLSTLKTSGANVNVTLWHEPFFSGLSAAQYVAMVRYYGPTVRKYYPLWCVFSGADANVANGFYPGDAYCDGVAVDAYAASGTTQITNAQSIADAGGKPFGVWEFNGGADLGQSTAIQGQTQAAVTAHFQYLQDLFTARLAAGKPNGDLLLFSSGGNNGSSNFLGTSLSANGGFETGLGNWISGSGTIAQTAVQAHSGTKSAQITSPGGGGTSNILMCATGSVTTQGIPCAAGQIVAAMGWFRSAVTARLCRIDIAFFDGAGAALSVITGGTITDSTSAWTSTVTSGTAPASTAFARIVANALVTAAAEVHYFDDPEIAVLPAVNDLTSPIQYPWDYRIALLSAMQTALDGTSFPQTFTVTRGVGGVAFTHPTGAAVSLWRPAVLAL